MRENRSQAAGARALQVFGQHRDESHRQGAAGDQSEEQVGEVIGGVECVQLGGETETAGYEILARKPSTFSRPKKTATIRVERERRVIDRGRIAGDEDGS